jgi:hypothetical protein
VQFDLTNPGLWIAASAALAVIATNVAWMARWLLRGRALGDGQREAARIAAWLVAALFYALLPVLAWRSGALSPYLMGLGEVDWVQSLAAGLFLALLAAGTLFVAWILGTRRPRAARETGARQGSADAWLTPLDAALLQWHWAFYRAGAAGWLLMYPDRLNRLPFADAAVFAPVFSALAANPFYWGSWLGMGLVALEWGLNPFARAALRDPVQRPYALLRLAIAFASTAVLVATRNFWLALLLHITVAVAAAIWRPLVESLAGNEPHDDDEHKTGNRHDPQPL